MIDAANHEKAIKAELEEIEGRIDELADAKDGLSAKRSFAAAQRKTLISEQVDCNISGKAFTKRSDVRTLTDEIEGYDQTILEIDLRLAEILPKHATLKTEHFNAKNVREIDAGIQKYLAEAKAVGAAAASAFNGLRRLEAINGEIYSIAQGIGAHDLFDPNGNRNRLSELTKRTFERVFGGGGGRYGVIDLGMGSGEAFDGDWADAERRILNAALQGARRQVGQRK